MKEKDERAVAFFRRKKGQAPKGLPLEIQWVAILDSLDIFSLGAFFALGHNELYLLAFDQSFETVTNDGAEVGENIWTGLLLNKAKTFSFVKPLYRTCSRVRHNITFYI